MKSKFERGAGCLRMHLRKYLGDGVCRECGKTLYPCVLEITYRKSKWYENENTDSEITISSKFHRWIEE